MEKYSEHYNRIISEINENLNAYFPDNLTKYPIAHSNEFGEWILYEDGKLLVKPNYAVESININIKITKDGCFYDDE